MNAAKINILKDTLENKFEIDQFRKFSREFFNELELYPESRSTGIWREYSDYINAYYKVGNYEDEGGNEIIVMAVELKSLRSVESARSMQRNFVSKVLDENNKDAAIVAFYTEGDLNWRLSFVKLDYSLTDKGIKIELTPAKRYSYLVGEREPSHTAQKRLFDILKEDRKNPSIEDIEEAFSVEEVTKDFFKDYREKYLKLKEYLESNGEFIEESEKLGFEVNKFAEQFAKKLMGQLAFLYFLQKKGWLGVRIVPKEITKEELVEIYKPLDKAHKDVLEKAYENLGDNKYEIRSELLASDEFSDHDAELLSDIFIEHSKYNRAWGTGSKRFIRKILWKHCESSGKNFFDDYLEPFFYGALNKKRKNQYFKSFNSKVPFLNGGLFEPLEGYHWRDTNFEIPNEFFSNGDEAKKDGDGILDIFDRYNFTIKEDEPLEKEVAVDPEMLGKIFEELLDVSDRKSKGAFYTPREIVHYMCQESLTNYLVNEVKVPYEDIKEFILYGDIIKDSDNSRESMQKEEYAIKPSVFEKIVEIDRALDNVRVADPAVGSGAFPLGMLNEITRAKNNITEYIVKKDGEGALGRRYGAEAIRKAREPYALKLNAIKNSLFAVDIEPSAVDITKLRLWLSVVVDQEIEDELEGPHQLPNLDMNIHVGNSLIDEYEGIKLFDESILKKERAESGASKGNQDIAMQLNLIIDQSDQMLEDMFELQNRYFDEDSEGKKRELKEKIENIQRDLIRYKLNREGNAEGLKKYDESQKEKTKPYFIWELEFAKVFQEKGGFDIVIGNPPYVGEKGNKEIFRPIAKTEFGKKYYQGKMDLFYFFFHKGINSLNCKGVLSFITTNYFVTASGAKKLREDFKERVDLIKLINFNELKIFESALGQHNMITILTREKRKGELLSCVSHNTNVASTKELVEVCNFRLKEKISYFRLKQSEIYDGDENYIRVEGNNSSKDIKSQILSLMTLKSEKLGMLFNVNQGARTGADKVTNSHIKKYRISDYKKGEGIFVIDDKDELESEIIKPWFKNSDIKKYRSVEKSKEYVIYTKKDMRIDDYPKTKKHLSKYKIILEGRWSEYPWWCLDRPRNQEIFDSEKIICPQRSYYNTFAYNDIPWYSSADVYYITKKSQDYDLKYLIALLNSKLYYFWLYHRGKRKGEMLEH